VGGGSTTPGVGIIMPGGAPPPPTVRWTAVSAAMPSPLAASIAWNPARAAATSSVVGW
jgi:hypothetical protein